MNQKQVKQLCEHPRGSQIVIHNHSGSASSSSTDIYQCAKGGYKYGVIVCHNGDIIAYRTTKEYQDINYSYVSRQFARIDSIRNNPAIDEDGRL